MAEIRIPSDQIPADIWRRLRDISSKVIAPFSSTDNPATSLLSSTSSSISSSPSLSSSSSSSLLSSVFSHVTPPQPISDHPARFSMSTTTATTTMTLTSHPFSISTPASHTHPSPSTRTCPRSSKHNTRAPRQTVNRHGVPYDTNQDEVDGGHVDSSIVHVVDDASLRHQKSSNVFAMEVMDDSDIVRIFPDADTKARAPNSTSADSKLIENARRLSADSGIVRIFTDQDDEDDDDNHDDNDDGNAIAADGSDDVVDHMNAPTFNNNNSNNNNNNAFDETKQSRTSTFRISPGVFPSFVQETPSNANTHHLSVPATYSTNPFCEAVGVGEEQGEQEVQRTGVQSTHPYDHEGRLSRKFLPGSSPRALHQYTQDNNSIITRRKPLPGKSANPDVFPNSPHSTQAVLDQYRLLQHAQYSLPRDGVHAREFQNLPVGNNNNNNFHPNCQLLLPTTTSSTSITGIETTPTKNLPSKFGKIRRSPVLLPTPPQTPDDAGGDDDDDDVFSYDDVIGRSCTATIVDVNKQTAKENPPPSPSPSSILHAHFRRNSDSRATETGVGSGVRRPSINTNTTTRLLPSPFPYTNSPTHKMARMKVGDRQHTRKRLSFEDVDTSASESLMMTHQPDVQQLYWAGPNHAHNNRQMDAHQQIPASTAMMVRGTSISPFNSPPPQQQQQHSFHHHHHHQRQQQQYQHRTNSPASKSTSPAPFSSSSSSSTLSPPTSFDNPNLDTNTSQTLMACCAGATGSTQCPSRPSQRQLSHASSYPFLQSLHHDVPSTPHKDIPESRPSKFSPSQPLPVPRVRIHSEGFPDDMGEQPPMTDVTRSINSNDDLHFQTHTRGQAMTSYGKRRRYECDFDDDETSAAAAGDEDVDMREALLPLPPFPASHGSSLSATPKKTPPSAVPSCITTTNNNNLHNHHNHPTSPNQPSPRHQTLSPTHSHNTRSVCPSNNNDNNNNNNQQQAVSTPRSNCSCALFMRNFLSMASGAYENLNTTPRDFSTFRQEMSHINDILRESMAILYKINTICEHHKTGTSSQTISDDGQASSTTTISETVTHTQGACSSPSNNLTASFTPSFQPHTDKESP